MSKPLTETTLDADTITGTIAKIEEACQDEPVENVLMACIALFTWLQYPLMTPEQHQHIIKESSGYIAFMIGHFAEENGHEDGPLTPGAKVTLN